MFGWVILLTVLVIVVACIAAFFASVKDNVHILENIQLSMDLIRIADEVCEMCNSKTSTENEQTNSTKA